MRVGIISDTHIPKRAKEIPQIVLTHFEKVDHIIHAGDVTNMETVKRLMKIAPLTVVTGNADLPELRAVLNEKETVTLNGFSFGVFHGHGEGKTTIERAKQAFASEKLDCVVFGHSHIPYCGLHNQVLFFNPGSPTDKRRNSNYSFGILVIEDQIIPQILYF